jgi:hypothetical protein
VVVRERRVNLRQRQVAELPHDLLGNETHIVPLCDPANGDACSSNAWSASSNVRVARNQAANLGYDRHRPQV